MESDMTSINFHHVKKIEARYSDGHTWLHVENRNGDHVALHMDADLCDMMADAFAEWDSQEPEPISYDDALAMRCDADARTDEAMRLKGMV